jgi:tol-pal system protein YbgF
MLLLALAVSWASVPHSSLGASKEIIQIMAQLDDLQKTVRDIQRAQDTQNAVLKTLIEQANDNVNTMKAQVAEVKKANEENLAASQNRLDAMTSQIQQLEASLDEAKGRLAKLSDQLTQTQNIIQTLGNPTAGAGGAIATPGGSSSKSAQPDPDSLYQSAYSYYEGGQYDLAIQAFQEYLQNFSDSDRASNAQFYIGDCYYKQKKYAEAVDEYNKCIEQYPKGGKIAAAQLKKGYALLLLNQKTAGVRELNSLIRRFPKSEEAQLARQKLRSL